MICNRCLIFVGQLLFVLQKHYTLIFVEIKLLFQILNMQ